MSDPSTRERILAAAAAILRDNGVEAASARAICHAAGITAPTLYHHFGDIEGLYRAVVEHAFHKSAKHKRQTQRKLRGLAAIRAGWDSYVTFARNEPVLFALMNRALVTNRMPDVAWESLGVLEKHVRELADGQALSCSPELAARMLWAAAHGTACLALAGRLGSAANGLLSRALRESTLNAILAVNPSAERRTRRTGARQVRGSNKADHSA
jgi:AcrR family transcriptional regulator